MKPPTAKHEGEIADSLGKWQRNRDMLEKVWPQCILNMHFKTTAVISMLCRRAKDEYDVPNYTKPK